MSEKRYTVEVTEEQNRDWHRANLREAMQRIERVEAGNVERLRLAWDDLEEAREWADQEGLSRDEIQEITSPTQPNPDQETDST